MIVLYLLDRRKVILVRQNYRCAGCGAKVEPGKLVFYVRHTFLNIHVASPLISGV